MTPKTALPVDPPHELDGHALAQKIWRRTVKIYDELEATIATGLDRDHLMDYCLATEEVAEMEKSLGKARANIEKLERKMPRVRDSEKLADLLKQLNHAYKLLINLNGRIDRKRVLCIQMRHDLYLTPRSRAGVNPGGKPPEEPKDPMEELLEK